jgi:DNA-binding transcriptional ArsR family regulator
VIIDPATAARQLTPALKALADENRLAIALTLAQSPSNVVELAGALGMGQTLVSHHLKTLREAGLVAVTPIGRSNVYSLCCEGVAEPVRHLARLAGLDVTEPILDEIGARS